MAIAESCTTGIEGEPQHFISGDQITPEVFERISETTERLLKPYELELARQELGEAYPLGAAAVALFLEPSARTRYSHLRAAARLGVDMFQEPHPKQTLSMMKGESIEDTFVTFDALGYELIVYRSDVEGAAAQAAQNTRRASIINAGDGKGHHPTQTVLDLETIKDTFGSFDGLTLAHVGDPANSRTTHSLIDALSHYDTHHVFSTSDELGISEEYRRKLTEKGVSFEVVDDVKKAAQVADIFYMNRLQGERQKQLPGEADEDHKNRLDRIMDGYLRHAQIRPDVLTIVEKRGVRLMHPWPRNQEIPAEYTYHPSGLWLQQMEQGVNTRTATMYLILMKRLLTKSVKQVTVRPSV
jgi:aspartate carbamoyltransferase catalytic subunit